MSKTSEKIIYLARHAKSSWSSQASNDFDRPLSQRDESDAHLIASELSKQNWKPEKIIASPALRAKQTCLAFCESLNIPDGIVEWDKNIYEAHMITLLQKLSSLPESLQSVMLIGHNPSMENLLLHLSDHVPRQDNGKILTTGNVAKLSTSTLWEDMILQNMTLKGLLRPKER